MRAWTRLLGSAGPLALLAGAPGAGHAEEQPAAPLESGFLEFLAEEADVDEELSEALMSADLDRAIENSRRRSKVNEHGND